MKKNKFLPVILFTLAAITACFLTATCKDFLLPNQTENIPQAENRSALDRKDELALLRSR